MKYKDWFIKGEIYRIRWEKLEVPSEGWRHHRTAVDDASLPLAKE